MIEEVPLIYVDESDAQDALSLALRIRYEFQTEYSGVFDRFFGPTDILSDPNPGPPFFVDTVRFRGIDCPKDALDNVMQFGTARQDTPVICLHSEQQMYDIEDDGTEEMTALDFAYGDSPGSRNGDPTVQIFDGSKLRIKGSTSSFEYVPVEGQSFRSALLAVAKIHVFKG